MADPELESRYRARRRYLHQQATNLQEAEQRGIEQGRQQGIDQAHRETARKMKQMGMDPSVISEATGVSQVEIEGL